MTAALGDRINVFEISYLSSSGKDANRRRWLVGLMGARLLVMTGSSNRIAQVIPGHWSRVKAANFLELNSALLCEFCY